MPRHSTDPGLGANEIDVLRKRERYGWFVTMIAADVAGPGFAYSFGLYQEFEHPEVILFGLPGSTLHRLVNDLGERIRSGAKYRDGDRVLDLLDPYPCVFRAVNRLQYRGTVTWASWFYEQNTFPVLQVFWPDKKSRFPWELGFDESLRALQPDLSKPPPSA
jgi:hypothetical protein